MSETMQSPKSSRHLELVWVNPNADKPKSKRRANAALQAKFAAMPKHVLEEFEMAVNSLLETMTPAEIAGTLEEMGAFAHATP